MGSVKCSTCCLSACEDRLPDNTPVSWSQIRSLLVTVFLGAIVLATVNLTHSSTFREDVRGSSAAAASHLTAAAASHLTAPCDSTALSPLAGGSLADAGAATADPRVRAGAGRREAAAGSTALTAHAH